MPKALKVVLWVLGGLILLMVLAAVALAALFDPNKYKPQIERLAKEHTGRTLTLGGDLSLAFWPSLGAKVSAVSLSERTGSDAFVSLDSAHLAVKVMPLVRGELVVDALTISGLNARVVKGKDGKFNFDDLIKAGEGKPPARPEAGAEKGGEAGAVKFDVSGIRIENSSITYRDLAAGSETTISDVSLSTGRLAPQAEGKMQMGATMKARNPDLDARLDVRADYRLDLPRGVSLPSLAVDLTASGPQLPMKTVKIPVTGTAEVNLEKETLAADLASRFDESSIKAKLGLAKFSPPSYVFDVNVDRLNVDRYLPKEPEGAKPAAKPAPGAGKAEDTPVDLSAIRGLQAQGRLQVGSLQVKGLKLADLRADVRAANNRLDVAPHSANLYEGAVNGALSLHADGNRIAIKETLKGIAIGPLLRDAAQVDRLEGKGDVSLDVTGAGKTVEAIKKALAGSAKVQLKDGAIKGVDIGAILRRARTALGRDQAQAQATAERTDFSEMSASFAIKNGVAHNEDLEVKAPLFRVTGRGDVDIGNSTLDYTVKAAVVASAKGQGGDDLSQLAGVTVPVRLTGTFDALKYDVNYGAVAADIAKSRVGERVKERLGDPKLQEKVQDRLKGLLGR